MQYLLLGFAALLGFLLVTRIYMSANPQVLARQLRVGAGLVALTGAGLLVLRGLLGYAISLATLGAWLLWGHSGLPGFSGRAPRSAGQTSRVTTEHLEVELDHDTGDVHGRVLKGAFAGRRLEDLKPVELARLWQECRLADPPSAQILEAYLDRLDPAWREDMERQRGRSDEGAGPMTRAEALEILGLAPGASEDDIRRAHRELIMKLHPDHGGSTYLAAKINEAKEALVGK
jgi:hypothetical protein